MTIHSPLSGVEGNNTFAPSASIERDAAAALQTCRVVLGDRHPLALEGLAQVLRNEPGLLVVERCTSGSTVLHSIRRHLPDLALLDIRLPEPNGLEVLKCLRNEGVQTPVILMTDALEDDEVIEGMRLGIRGLVSKRSSLEAVVDCVRTVRSGGMCLDQPLVGRAMFAMLARDAALRELGAVLTAKELEVVRFVSLGCRNREIAERLFVSGGTLKVHLHHIYEKLGVGHRDELIAHLRAKQL